MNYLESFLKSFQENKFSLEWIQLNDKKIINAKKNILLSFQNFNSLNNNLKKFHEKLLNKKLFKELYSNEEIFNLISNEEIFNNRYLIYFLLSIVEYEENIFIKLEQNIPLNSFYSAFLNNDNFSIEQKKEIFSKDYKSVMLLYNLNLETISNTNLKWNDALNIFRNKELTSDELELVFKHLITKYPDKNEEIVNLYLTNDLSKNNDELKEEIKKIIELYKNDQYDDSFLYIINKYKIKFDNSDLCEKMEIKNKVQEFITKNLLYSNSEFSNKLIKKHIEKINFSKSNDLSHLKNIFNESYISYFSKKFISNIYNEDIEDVSFLKGLFYNFKSSEKYIYEIIKYIEKTYSNGQYINNIILFLNEIKMHMYEFEFKMYYEFMKLNIKLNNYNILQMFESVCLRSESEKYQIVDLLYKEFQSQNNHLEYILNNILKIEDMILEHSLIDKITQKYPLYFKKEDVIEFERKQPVTILSRYCKSFYKFSIENCLDKDFSFKINISKEIIKELINCSNNKKVMKLFEHCVFEQLDSALVESYPLYFVINKNIQSNFISILVKKVIESKNDDFEENMFNEFLKNIFDLKNITIKETIYLLNILENPIIENNNFNLVLKVNNDNVSFEEMSSFDINFIFSLLALNKEVKYAYEVLKEKNVNINDAIDSFSIKNQNKLIKLFKISDLMEEFEF